MKNLFEGEWPDLASLRDNFNTVEMDGYDDCIVGICYRYGQEDIVAYDLDKVLAKLVAEGCTQEEAEEFWEFNQLGAWVGDKTPCFIRVHPR
jgi:hypothetical protein